jgi:hypothetical protein
MKNEDNEDFRRYLIDGNGGALVGEFAEPIKRLRYYIETREKFISDQEITEVNALGTEAEKLKEKARGEFWSWYYPVHWDEIFRTNLRVFVRDLADVLRGNECHSNL